MDILLMHKKNQGLFYSPEKEISQSIFNKKANGKLNYVVEIFKTALGRNCLDSRDGFLSKTLILQGLRYLKDLKLIYKIENRLFAISYDLVYESKIELDDKFTEKSNLQFTVKLKGVTSITGAEFIAKNCECDEVDIKRYLERLNNKLIIDRIVALDLTDIKVSYNVNTATWKMSCKSLIGSTTWNFIPPVFQLITPKKDECVKVIEFFELVFDSVINKD